MKKKKVILIIGVVLVLVVSYVLISINSDIRKLERRIDVNLPKSSNLIYIKNKIGWFGEGAIISVLNVDENQIEALFYSIDEGKPYELFTDEEFETEVNHVIDTFLTGISEEHRPDWNNDYDWVDGSNNRTVYYIYDYKTDTLYIIENVF